MSMMKTKKASLTSTRRSTHDHSSKMERSHTHKEHDSLTDKDEFSSTFKRLCLECTARVTPDVHIISSDSTIQKASMHHHTKSMSTNTDITEIHPEVLAVKDSTIQVITKIIFQHFTADKNLLVALLKTFQVECYVTTLSLEFCNMTATEIKILHLILKKNQTINELSINGNPNDSQNFYLLLKNTNVRSLSLRFCKIDEYGIAKIVEEMKLPYVQTLTHLNLSSNFISDEGARHIANGLRVNRCLKYLNLADCHISDVGCIAIMEVLQTFPLKLDELVFRRQKILAYYMKKREEISLPRSKISLSLSPTHSTTRRSSQSLKRLRLEKTDFTKEHSHASLKSVGSKMKKLHSMMEKNEQADSHLYSFDNHPFIIESFQEKQEVYCKGNYSLTSLNLSYNKINQAGLRMIMQMLMYQGSNFEESKGITRLVLVGVGTSPNCSHEMNNIYDLLAQKNGKRRDSVTNSYQKPSLVDHSVRSINGFHSARSVSGSRIHNIH